MLFALDFSYSLTIRVALATFACLAKLFGLLLIVFLFSWQGQNLVSEPANEAQEAGRQLP